MLLRCILCLSYETSTSAFWIAGIISLHHLDYKKHLFLIEGWRSRNKIQMYFFLLMEKGSSRSHLLIEWWEGEVFKILLHRYGSHHASSHIFSLFLGGTVTILCARVCEPVRLEGHHGVSGDGSCCAGCKTGTWDLYPLSYQDTTNQIRLVYSYYLDWCILRIPFLRDERKQVIRTWT